MPARRRLLFSLVSHGVGRETGVHKAFMDKFAPQLTPGSDHEPMSDALIDCTAVFRLDVERWSGKHG